jgi:phospholipase/carboxylesterase
MTDGVQSRRRFIGGLLAGTTIAAGSWFGLRRGISASGQGQPARLRSRPGAVGVRLGAGRHPLPPGAGGRGFLYVPESVAASGSAAPLLVLLHGAGRTLPDQDAIVAEADRRGFVLVVPAAANHTWDLMMSGSYAGDIGRLDAALAGGFAAAPIDPAHLCLAGFSDGASYALSVGLQNGDLFSHLIAFSPGFIGPGRPVGAPRVFVSHGTGDRVLPIDRTGRRVVASLELRELDHTFHEFDGGHSMPAAIRSAAFDWFLGSTAAGS